MSNPDEKGARNPPPASRDSPEGIFRLKNRRLGVFFAPRSVAVIGASESAGSVGRTVVWNLIRSPFGGTVFPVNPKQSSVLGIRTYARIADVPEKVDLAVVATPAATVPEIISQCVDAHVQGAIVVSAGFKESGAAGEALEQEIRRHALRGRMRVIGPNCLGVMCPTTGLNASFAAAMARPGSVGFISQSGALCTAVLDWSLREMVGFSSFISVGGMVDVSWGDLIDYLGDDPRTRSIVIYMESIGDAQSFLSAAREVSLTKPIIVMKSGRTEAAARAAASHTGALTGSDDVLDAAFRRCGVLRVNNISDLFYMAEVLSRQPRPKGGRLAIVSNAGGPGVMAADAVIVAGAELAELSAETLAGLDALLPPHWSHGNPVDVLSDASPERYAQAVDLVAKDPNSDGVLVILTPQALTDPTRTAEQMKPYARLLGKPILASWMGGAEVAAGESILNRADIPTFPYPDSAARAFQYMWRYTYNLRGIYETPVGGSAQDARDRSLAADIISNAHKDRRTLLTEYESKRILAAYGIAAVQTQLAASEADAVRLAEEIGYPVALKVNSETIVHKQAAGGVELNLFDANAVRCAYLSIQEACSSASAAGFSGVTVQPMVRGPGYELALGCGADPQFGPVILFGSGGALIEVYKDRALALPPLNSTLARRLMEQTRIFEALEGRRGTAAVNLRALEQVLVRFSELILELHSIREMDVNPLFVSGGEVMALDARIVLFEPGASEDSRPMPAIRPYPAQYATTMHAKDGTLIHIRPIRPEDEPMMARFHETLSDRSVYFRYFHPMRLNARVAHERLVRMCFIDYAREMAIVAETRDPAAGACQIVGVGRYIRLHATNIAEFAVLVSDSQQRQGVGTELLRRLVEIGRQEKLSRIVGDILPDNRDMLRVCEKLGFTRRYDPESGVVRAEIEL
jgi:acetyltransferase